jgi:hypothetical protein
VSSPPDAARLAKLQEALNARRSIFHLAHAALSGLIGLIAAGTAGRLYWDYGLDQLPLLGAAVVVATIMLAHASVRWVLGRRELGRELAWLSELKDLRRTLGLDDPSLLLPR